MHAHTWIAELPKKKSGQLSYTSRHPFQCAVTYTSLLIELNQFMVHPAYLSLSQIIIMPSYW